MTTVDQGHRARLTSIARRAMLEHGLLADPSPAALAELAAITGPAVATDARVPRDLTDRPWCSIDNDDSLDLDQLTVAEALPDDRVRILVAIADVDALVKAGSALDGDAQHNTTSVYTAARTFSMLPEKLSNGFTSLNCDEERLAIVVDMVLDGDGAVQAADVYPARVCNRAKLAYGGVTDWLEGKTAAPPALDAAPGLADNLRLQDQAGQRLQGRRHVQGALTLRTIEARPVFDGDQLRDLAVDEKDRAKAMIEDFMIAANGAVARYLADHNCPVLRRVVRTPERWPRIVELAEQHGGKLPDAPDARALEEFLLQAQAADPQRFPDLSLAIVKLLGAGEYVAEAPGESAPGHFGLAVKDYAHATAPNRRYADLLTQRLLHAALTGAAPPYSADELAALAKHCTEMENEANKVERQVAKAAAALLLESRIGEQFDALVTGATAKGTWVRLLKLPVEGKLVQGFAGLDVGDQVRVQLRSVDVEQGFIDFIRR